MKTLTGLFLLLAMLPCGERYRPWQRARLPEVTLEYRVTGAGDAVVFIHGGLFADGLEPLAHSRVLQARHRILEWHRVGYARSGPAAGHAAIAAQAAQLVQLMQRAGMSRAHVVGHSSGGLIALQLARDHPRRVASLVLLEPALPVPGVASPGIAQALQAYERGDRARAIDMFMRSVAGDSWVEDIQREITQPFRQALADAPAFFEQELPAVRAWQFAESDARGISAPVLAVMGGLSPQVSANWPKRQEFLLAHLPHVEAYVLPGARHMLALQAGSTLAQRLGEFFARHRVSTPVSFRLAPTRHVPPDDIAPVIAGGIIGSLALR